MATLLHVDSSPDYNGSVSRQLSRSFVDQWQLAHPGARIIERDLNAIEIPPVSAEWIEAVRFSTPENRTPRQKELLALSATLIGELREADEYVFGVPMYNFMIPAVLKLWIDQITQAGQTFSYADGTPKGLLTGKKATIIVASGGNYDANTPMSAFNFIEPYLRWHFKFLGITDTTFIHAGGTKALHFGQDREVFLAPFRQAVESKVKSA